MAESLYHFKRHARNIFLHIGLLETKTMKVTKMVHNLHFHRSAPLNRGCDTLFHVGPLWFESEEYSNLLPPKWLYQPLFKIVCA